MHKQLAKSEITVLIDGKYIPSNQATVHGLNYTFLYGVGVFEGIRVYQTNDGRAAFRLPCHIDRLFQSAKILNLNVQETKAELLEHVYKLMSYNTYENAYIRPMFYVDAEGFMGLRPKQFDTKLMIAVIPWQNIFTEKQQEKGLKLITSHRHKMSPLSYLSKAKANSNYVTAITALQEASHCNADDILMCDSQGFVAEASGANIFAVKQDTLITPHTTSALAGITRDSILKIAEVNGIKTCVTNMTVEDVYCSDEVFLVGTATEVSSVCMLDGREISASNKRPVTHMIANHYQDIVRGKNKNYCEWLTFL